MNTKINEILINSSACFNANKLNIRLSIENMSSKYIAVVVAITIMLVGATASTGEIVFADKKKYEKSQTVPQANACADHKLPMGVLCSNTASQIQGNDNSVADASVQIDGKDGFKKKKDW
jgi:hypothetical protein